MNNNKKHLTSTIYLYDLANVLDSVIPAAHFVCNNYLPCPDVGNRFSTPQINLNSPESRALGPSIVFGDIGGLFF